MSSAQRLAQRARDLGDRVGKVTGASPDMVQKSYPTTTHAKTIEFRVAERATLDALYASLNQAWREGSGRRFAIAQ